MDLLSTLGLLLVAGALVAVALTAARGRRLRGRIHRRLLAVAIVPAVAVAGFSVWGYSGVLDLLEAPGLEEPAEGALHLARVVLAQERDAAESELEAWRGNAGEGRPGWRPPPPPAGARILVTDPRDGAVRWRSRPEGPAPEEAVHAARLRAAEPGPRSWSGRWTLGERDWVAAVRPFEWAEEPAELWLLRPLDPALTRALTQVESGTRGLAQLRLYYGDLLRQQGLWVLGVLLLLVVVVSLEVSRRLARGLAAPLDELAGAARRVARRERDIALPAAGDDELGDLVRAFRAMTADLAEGEERLRRSERLAAWRDVARRLAHEIKNPLTPIHLAAHRMRRQSDDARVHEGLDTILEETEQLRRLAEEFSTFARLPRPRPTAVDPRPHLEQVLRLYAGDRPADWSAWEEGVLLRADEAQLRRVLANLVKNAAEASAPDAPLRLRCGVAGVMAVLEIEDEGEGLPEEASRLFEPDFTTRGAGTGLGLPICRRIVEDHGGRIEARPGSAGGACLRVEWPQAEEES